MLPFSNLIYLENGFPLPIVELEVTLKISLPFWEKTHFTVSDVQVPPLHSITMSPYRTFKGMAPGHLTVYGTMLLIRLMLVLRWQPPSPPCYPEIWGLGFLCLSF